MIWLDSKASLMLMIFLVLMLSYEPYIYCWPSDDWPTEYCDEYTDDDGAFSYSVLLVASHRPECPQKMAILG